LRPRIACGRFEEERYSFPLFFAVDYDTKVQPLDRFVTEERPAKEGLTAGEHLFAQTAQSLNYLKARLAKGEIKNHMCPCRPSGRKRDTAPMTKADPTAFLARRDNPVSARLRERALSLGKSALAIYVGIPT
jgi:hypothetical protein